MTLQRFRIDGIFCSAIAVLAALSLVLVGCSRSKARLRADRDANCLIDQKAPHAGASPGDYRITIDRDSRMFDPHSPDCPPMPPDDPASHRYMHCVDGKKGAKYWREACRTSYVDPPKWRQYLPLNNKRELILDTEAAVQLALKNDPRFQQEVEELYLSALDVSFERFRFDTQLFGGSSVDYIADGRARTGSGESSSLLTVSPSSPGNRYRLQKLSATGSELVVGLANSLVWQFAGPDDYFGSTLLDFTLVQPLLRNGGRLRVLEQLTQSERTLLANVRSMERFQREYYLNIVTGRGLGAGAQRGGIFFSLLNNGAGAVGSGAYLGLLQEQQVLRNQRQNVFALLDSTEQLVASYEAGRIDRFQVELARQALFNAQSGLLNAQANYETRIDQFKINLGLPPDLNLVVEDPILDQFNLLSPDVTDLQNKTAQALEELREIQDRPQLALARPQQEDQLPIRPEAVLPAEVAEEVGRLVNESLEQLIVVEKDLAKLDSQSEARKAHLVALSERLEVNAAKIDRAIFDPVRFEQRRQDVHRDYLRIKEGFELLLVKLESPTENEIAILTDLSGRLLDLSILQARIRLDSIDLDPVQLEPQEALRIASLHRRDWANARASLVDSWRQIHFAANDLESALDVVFSGDIGNVGDNPFRLRDTNGRLRVGLEFDSPTSRLAERNVYRETIIRYQQDRRAYYQFVDQINQGLRSILRQTKLNEINLELRREAVFVAIAQVDLVRLRLAEPPKPGENATFNNTTARDLVQALGDLLSAQNDLLSVWVNNRVQRYTLELDLGVMLIDSEGLRVETDQAFEAFLSETTPPMSGELRLLPPVCKEARFVPSRLRFADESSLPTVAKPLKAGSPEGS